MPVYALGDLAPTIAGDAFVHPDAVVIGDVTIGSESTVWPSAVLRGDAGDIVIGSATSIQDGAVLHTTPEQRTRVGSGCVIGHLAHLEGCVVEDEALVGSQATVLHGARVRSGGFVAAGALVTPGTDVPERAMALGVPAQIRPDSVDVDRMIREGAGFYRARGRRYRAELRRLD